MAANEEFFVDGVSITDLRVVDLKEQLEKRHLSKSGSKTILLKRLKDQLILERMQEAQAGKDPAAAPNIEMKSSGNDFVAQYLEQQQQMLQAAKSKAAQSSTMMGRSPPTSAASSTSSSTPGTPDVDNRLASPPSAGKRSRSAKNKSPRQSITEQETAQVMTVGVPALPAAPAAASTLIMPTPMEIGEQADSGAVDLRAPIPVESKPETPTAAASPTNLDTQRQEEHVVDQKKPEPKGEAIDTQFPITGERMAAAAPQEEKRAEIVSEELPDVEPRRLPSPPRDEEMDAKTELKPSQDVGQSGGETKDPEVGGSPDEREESPALDLGTDSTDMDMEISVHPKKHQVTTTEEPDDDALEIPNAADDLLETVKTVSTGPNGSKKMESDDQELSQGAREQEQRDIPQRKRKWVATTLNKRTALSISSDSLKQIVGSVKEDEKPEIEDSEEMPASKRIIVTRVSNQDVGVADSSTELESDFRLNRRIDVEPVRSTARVTEDGFVRMGSLSPARHPPSNIVHIRGLTRPLTLSMLHELLGKFGTFSKEDFWIDNIKSHCIVKYSDESEAVLARDRLHNIQWPSSSTKCLRVEFATEEDLQRYRTQESQGTGLSRQNTENDRDRLGAPKVTRDVREVSKVETEDRQARRSASPRRAGNERTFRSGESPPTDPRGAGGGLERRDAPAPAGKILEELFHKTKAAPCIYWLPLSEEQVREKERERKRRGQERFERVKKMEEDERERERDRRRDTYRRPSPVDYRNRRR